MFDFLTKFNLEDSFRQLVGFLDAILVGLVGDIYELLLDISSFTFLKEDIVKDFSNRLYVLIGLFMLFKLSFSFINYVVNPDQFQDKEKGAGKVINNILITLVLLVMTPTFFNLAFDFQNILVRDNVIPNIILGTTNIRTGLDKTLGDRMGFTIATSFLRIDNTKVPECDPIYVDGVMSVTTECTTKLEQIDNSIGKKVVGAFEEMSANALFRGDVLNFKLNDEDKSYIFAYSAGVSTVTLAFTAVLLVSFCIDIAIRTVKLMFLQLLAPAAIISYVDPKSAKSGLFSKWLKMCLQTYLDLFIRLAAISFAVFIIELIVKNVS